MSNTLLDGLRDCFEVVGSNFHGQLSGANATLQNGASVSEGMLHLVNASGQYANVPHNALYEFDGAYTLLATFTPASLPGPFDEMVLLSKGDMGAGEEVDYNLAIEGSRNSEGNPDTACGALFHSNAQDSIWAGETLYTPTINRLYAMFGYFVPATEVPGPFDTATVRIYSEVDAGIETTVNNPYTNGSWHYGTQIFIGGSTYNVWCLDGTIVRVALWDRLLSDDEMDIYWNDGVPLAFSQFETAAPPPPPPPTPYVADIVIAFARKQIERTMVDSCVFLRPYSPPSPESGTPVTGTSDSRGGSTGGRGQTGVDVDGFTRDVSPTKCRLEHMPPKEVEDTAQGNVLERTKAILAVPITTLVDDRDRIEVTQRANGEVNVWEINTQAPCTDGYSKQISIIRLGLGTINS